MGFFGDLFGGKSGVNAANNAAAAQQAANTQARGDITTGYTSAQGRISPYAQQGQQASTMYNDAIGVNGSSGYQNALANFNNDPFRQGQADATGRAIQSTFRRYNGSGMGNSGTAGAAVGRVGSDIYGSQVADYRNRLQGAGQQGFQAAQLQSNLDTGQGNALSGNSTNVGNIEANRLMQGEQARAAGRGNIMSAVGGAANLLMAGFAPGVGGASAFGNMSSMLGGGGGGGGVNARTGYANSLPWAPQNQYGYGA
jgi:hypothetical protein